MLNGLAMALVMSSLCCDKATAPAESPTLVVQVVDPVWLPVPGAQIEIRRHAKRRIVQKATSDKDGNARFWLEGDAEYNIAVIGTGFRKARLRAVRVVRAPPTSPSPTAYIQIRLRLAEPTMKID